VHSIAAGLMSESAAAYSAANIAFRVAIDFVGTNALVKSSFIVQSGYDFAVGTSPPIAADYQAMPSLAFYPLQVGARMKEGGRMRGDE
jgi:hypothetical protein